MFSLFQANSHDFDSVSLLGLTKLNKNKKRWHIVFATIYCSRAFASPFISKTNKIAHASFNNNVSIDVIEPFSNFPNINQTCLTQLVRQKNLCNLPKFNGFQGLAYSLKTNWENGILGDKKDILLHGEACGTNTYEKLPSRSFIYFVWEALKDLTILILLGCVTLSLGFGIKENGLKNGWYDGGSIFLAVFLVIAVSAISNFRQNRKCSKVSKVSNDISVDVVRNRRRKNISIFKIVVDDIVILKIRDQVPADGLFISGHSLQVDESSMMGESEHVDIDLVQNPFLFSGTKIIDGFGKILVTSVGTNTTWGETMSTISRDKDEQTPLQMRLNKLTSSIGKVGLVVAFLVLIVLLNRYFTGNTKDEYGNTEYVGRKMETDKILNSVIGIIAAAVTIIVVAIPEGLPLAVTLTLAYSMKRMMVDQAMVRKLPACETMGSASVICTDKTGTITFNQMKVTKFWVGKESIDGNKLSSITYNVVELFHQGVGLNTTGMVYKGSSGCEFKFSGSPTEKAILSWAVLEMKMDLEEVEKSYEIVNVETFNSTKKRSGVTMRKTDDNATD